MSTAIAIFLTRTAAEAINVLVRKLHKHQVAGERIENSGLNFNGSAAVFVAYENWRYITRSDATGRTQVAWFHDQRCGTKEHASGLHQGHFKLTSGYCVTMVRPFFMAPILRKFISPLTCFDALHRAIHKGDLANLDAEHRPLMRMVVGQPRNTGCTSHVMRTRKSGCCWTTLGWNPGL